MYTVLQAAKKANLSQARIYQFLKFIGIKKIPGEKLSLTEEQLKILEARKIRR